MIRHINVTTLSQGLHEFTAQVEQALRESGVYDGSCTLFARRTSAANLLISRTGLRRW